MHTERNRRILTYVVFLLVALGATATAGAQVPAPATGSVDTWRAYMTDDKFRDARPTLEAMLATPTAGDGTAPRAHTHEDKMLLAFTQLTLDSKQTQLRRRVVVAVVLAIALLFWRQRARAIASANPADKGA